MKIGITCYPTYGGSGVVATELGIELAANGHEVHFITYSQPFRLTGREHGIFYHEVPVSNYPLFEYPPYDLALATRMSEVSAYYELDLLHVHYAIPHSISAYLARQMLAEKKRRLPFVTTLHGTDITLVGLDHSYLPITRFGIDKSNGVTAISNYLRTQTVEQFRTKREIEVIPNFVNCDVYTPLSPEIREAGRAQFAEPGEKILIHLSNFRPVKRAVDAVEVFAEVTKEIPARLLMVGDGPDRSQAEYLARRKGIQDRIHFLGKQSSVNDLLPLADLMIMPSEMESFGLVALEAMACKVPTIATRVGGVPELINDPEYGDPENGDPENGNSENGNAANGRLFPVGDIQGMAAAAIELLSDDRKHAEMAAAGRQTAQQRFCASKIIPQYEAYYERVLDRTGDEVASESLP